MCSGTRGPRGVVRVGCTRVVRMDVWMGGYVQVALAMRSGVCVILDMVLVFFWRKAKRGYDSE